MKTSLLSERTKRRLLCHHLLLLLLSVIFVISFYALFESNDVKFRLSLATGYVGLIWLGVTLIIGSINVLRARNNPVSSDLRRDVGIWCGTLSLVHVAIGLQVHMGSMWLYFFRETDGAKRFLPRLDPFGLANYLGLFAVVIIILLLASSNDRSLRTLGHRRWKNLQRLNYALIIFVVLHSVAYQVIEDRKLPYILMFSVIVLTVTMAQIAAYLRQRN